jgi:hypothetical protein
LGSALRLRYSSQYEMRGQISQSGGNSEAIAHIAAAIGRSSLGAWVPPSSQKKIHCTVAHGPKLALRGVTSHLVTDMCMYSHAIVGVSPHDYGRAMVGYICPTHTVSVTYKLGVTAAGMIGHAPSPRPTEGKRPIAAEAATASRGQPRQSDPAAGGRQGRAGSTGARGAAAAVPCLWA